MKHTKGQNINGWLIVDKPIGVTSTYVVNQTRHLFNASKAGHTGTLDPFASGVLPIAFGEATKLIPYVTDGRKEYEFTLKFGAATDTLDPTGRLTAEGHPVPSVQQITSVLPQFIGSITQTPPLYSAIKIAGRRAYDLARAGLSAAIPQRKINIYNLEFLGLLSDSQAHFRVACSKGTYVRTLGADIAEKLGTVGYLTALRRTKCGNFSLSDTILLDNLKKQEYIAFEQWLRPLMTCLCDITVIALSQEEALRLRQGQKLSVKGRQLPSSKEAVAVLDGLPIAVVRTDAKAISPIRVFNL